MSNPFGINLGAPNPNLMGEASGPIPSQPMPQPAWQQFLTDPSIRYFLGNILSGVAGGGYGNEAFNQSYLQSVNSQQRQQALEEEERSNRRNEEIRRETEMAEVERRRTEAEEKAAEKKRESAFQRIAIIQARGGKVPEKLWTEAQLSPEDLPPEQQYRVGSDGSLIAAENASELSEDYGPAMTLDKALKERERVVNEIQQNVKAGENPTLKTLREKQAAAAAAGIPWTAEDSRRFLLGKDSNEEQRPRYGAPVYDPQTKSWKVFNADKRAWEPVEGEGPIKPPEGPTAFELDRQIALIDSKLATLKGNPYTNLEQAAGEIKRLEDQRTAYEKQKAALNPQPGDPIDAVVEMLKDSNDQTEIDAYLDAAGETFKKPEIRAEVYRRLALFPTRKGRR